MNKRTEMLGLPVNGYKDTQEMQIALEELKDVNMNLKADIERLEGEREQLRKRRDEVIDFIQKAQPEVPIREYQKRIVELLMTGRDLHLNMRPFEGMIAREVKRRRQED